MTKEIVFESDRICFCKWSKEDFEDFKNIATNPKVMKYIGTGELWSDERILGFILLVYIMFLPGYRAKLASEEYGGDIGFWEAHRISGVILKNSFKFLPIIGPFLIKKINLYNLNFN